MNNTTPKFWTWLFRKFCSDSFYEELQGDLEESFSINCNESGLRKAKSIYRKEVVKMIRPSVMKKIGSIKHQNRPAMFKNYSIVAFRSIFRNKLFSSINIIGLSISMAVGLVAITFLTEVNSYDGFHEKGERIYRIVTDITRPNQSPQPFATAPLLAGEKLSNDLAGIEKVVRVSRNLYGSFEIGNDKFPIRGIFTNSSFFEVFSFPLIYGDPKTALDDPNSIILTESTAKKIFGHTDVVGQTLKHSSFDQMIITGVIQDHPKNSHIKFEAIGSLQLLKARKSWLLTRWGQSTSTYLYALIPEDFQLPTLQNKLDEISKEENAKVGGYAVDLDLEALDDIFPHTGRANQFGIVMPKKIISNIIILAAIVVIAACFNYTNLSMARALKRAKEVGVRKVVGAKKSQLLFQFVMEAIFVAFLALCISFVLFRLIRPEFLTLSPYIERTMSLELTENIYLYFIAFAIVVGTLSGIVPALFMSKLKPVSIMKGLSTIKVSRGIDFRKVLTTLQFTLSMGFLILVTLVYKQYKFALNYDLGFTTENVLNVSIEGNDIGVLKSSFSQIPQVTGISTSSMTVSTGQYQSNHVKYNNPLDSVYTLTFDISPEYIDNMKHQLLAGSNFNKEPRQGQIIITEMLVKQLGITSIEEAIDKHIQLNNKSYAVIGVIKDFQARKIEGSITPVLLTSERDIKHYNMQLKISSDNIVNTMAKLEKEWAKIDDENNFEAEFYDEKIKGAYFELSSSIKTYGFLTGIAISISILGLLGMAVYTTESKLKELSIRKVLGAPIQSLVGLLSKGFVVMFVASATMAIPISYLVFQKTIVNETANRVNVGFWELSGGAFLIIAIALLTISSQTLKAARTNPAENLRND